MNRTTVRLFAAAALTATLTAACSSGTKSDTPSVAGPTPSASSAPGNSGHSGTPSAPAGTSAGTAVDGTTTAAANLRATLATQLQEHVYLAGIATGTALSQGPASAAFKSAAGTLDGNSVALSKSIASVYGDAAGTQFLALWRKHIGFFVNYTVGAATKNSAMKAKALKDLDGYRADFGAFIGSANPNLPKAAVAAELVPHIKTLAAAIDAQASKSPNQFALLQKAAEHMPMTAGVLAGGIAKQFPDKFAA